MNTKITLNCSSPEFVMNMAEGMVARCIESLDNKDLSTKGLDHLKRAEELVRQDLKTGLEPLLKCQHTVTFDLIDFISELFYDRIHYLRALELQIPLGESNGEKTTS